MDYALNWSLNGDGVTPSHQAFRLTKASAGAKLLGSAPSKPKGKGVAARRPASPRFRALGGRPPRARVRERLTLDDP